MMYNASETDAGHTPSRASVLMSVPNPKRTVPVSFFQLTEEDSIFSDESLPVTESSMQSASHTLRSTVDSLTQNNFNGNSGTTPDIFDIMGEGNATSLSISNDKVSTSRGVIGSTRKCKSSASIRDTSSFHLNGIGSSVDTSEANMFSLLAGGARPPSVSAANDRVLNEQHINKQPWEGELLNNLKTHPPICRPSSTPVYQSAISSLFSTSLSLEDLPISALDSDNSLTSKIAAVNGGIAGDLHLSSGSSNIIQQRPGSDYQVRGRDRDYSFGSLLGLNTSIAEHGRNSQVGLESCSMNQLSYRDAMKQGTEMTPNSLAVPNENRSPIPNGIFASDDIAISDAQDGWLTDRTTSREQLLRNSLPLGGTVSAPPLLNMYSYGYDSLNNTSAFGAQHANGSPFDSHPVSIFPPRTIADASIAHLASSIPAPLSADQLLPPRPDSMVSSTVRSPSPGVAAHQHENVKYQNISASDVETVEALVLRSCRDILVGAAEHSLKAVELANTLRARVGTEVLARIREKWGGLLSLLEKNSGMFRVDRIPKNDKVTLVGGGTVDNIVSRSNIVSSPDGMLQRPDSRTASNAYHSGDTHYGFTSTSYVGGAEGSCQSTSGGSGATRCLHVGNVPANMTEIQLMREFEKFGQLEGLKLVSQRNGSRRFAFVTFQTIEQAVSARHALSKVHPWKSAISFAHKDFGGSGGGHSQPSTAYPTPGHNSRHNSSIIQSTYLHDSRHVGVPRYGSRMYPATNYPQEFHNNSLYQLHSNPHHQMVSHGGHVSYPYLNTPYNAAPGAPLYWMPSQHSLSQPFEHGGAVPIPHNVDLLQQGQFPQQPAQQQNPQIPYTNSSHSAAAVAGSIERDCPVLQRLCDDTYVPTQPWPADHVRDLSYCSAVVAQLQQFGGSTTVSKLRGFLRNRISATDNIKSVPLKAMIVAYPQLFVLENNYVYLVDGGGGSASIEGSTS